MSQVDREVKFIKARNDKREYRRIVLKNSLEVFLISDPETDKSSASMDVNVGSFNDPDGLEGLAHFLEHMLFFASSKYPTEGSYRKYISEHGGSTNAFTSTENTNFHFDVRCDSFDQALDRFAQFFIEPLMSLDATFREIKAVDSENQKNMISDGCRLAQLLQHLSSKDHPYHRFTTGNLETLVVRPQSKGMDVREELIKFYDQNYSSSLMHLAVYAEKPLDDIQNLVEEKFEAIRNTGNFAHSIPGQPCGPEHLQILVKAVPLKEGNSLSLEWPITPDLKYYREGPREYLTHLIGHEGEGSLFLLLKGLGWATCLLAGGGERTNGYSFFNVTIGLTDAGQERMEDIVGLLFKYIDLVRNNGIDEWIFDEISAIQETHFHYQDKIDPMDYTVMAASHIKLYPPEDWLAASSLISIFDPNLISKMLNELTPRTVRILWVSKKFVDQTDRVEPWYGTNYSLEKISDNLSQKWIDGSPNEQLHLPKPNIFIPVDFGLKDLSVAVEYPVLLSSSSHSQLWYKPDTRFFTPKAFLVLDFSCSEASRSPEAVVMTGIFTSLLMDYLNEYTYDAELAGLYYGVSSTSSGFQVSVIGYNHKMKILLDAIIRKIIGFKVLPERFSVIKESMVKGYQNTKYRQPYDQAIYYSSLILIDRAWPWDEKLDALRSITEEDLANFVHYLISRTCFVCYAAGNITGDDAVSIVKDVEAIFYSGPKPVSKPLFPSQIWTNRAIMLQDSQSSHYLVEGLNPDDENSTLLNYFQIAPDEININIKTALLVHISKELAFHQLRTVEQLGYIVSLTQSSILGIQGMQVMIQSTVKDPEQLDQRVEYFLEMFETKLSQMCEEEFQSNVAGLSHLYLEKFKNMSEESLYYWAEIDLGTLKFDRLEAEAAALRDLSKKDVIEFFCKYIKFGSPQRKKLSVYVYGALHSSAYVAAVSGELESRSTRIVDIFSFKRSRPLFASFRRGIKPV